MTEDLRLCQHGVVNGDRILEGSDPKRYTCPACEAEADRICRQAVDEFRARVERTHGPWTSGVRETSTDMVSGAVDDTGPIPTTHHDNPAAADASAHDRTETHGMDGLILVKHRPNATLVKELEYLLELARSGEVHSVVVAAIGPGRQYDLTNYATRPIHLLGSVALAQAELIRILNGGQS